MAGPPPYGAALSVRQEVHAIKHGAPAGLAESHRMFQAQARQSMVGSAFGMLELIYHSTVREVRKSHQNALVGLLLAISQTAIFVLAFYLMFLILGLKKSAIRGDFVLYLLSGIFLFLTHTKAMGAVFGSESPTSAMMKHAPLNTIVTISAAALGSLYIQLLSLLVVLFLYHAIVNPVVIDDPIPAMGMFLLAWFSGVAIGIIFLALKPWFPAFTGLAQSIYSRANMIASGKMFVANSLPSSMLALFDWNPLFHCIDQARGDVFINYNPHYSSATYPLIVSLSLIMIGMMAEFFTRKNASASWAAGH
jgi:ABC-type polysaccharide/polyol phosphate export permease